jgi:small conductance mechanosensitive channel
MHGLSEAALASSRGRQRRSVNVLPRRSRRGVTREGGMELRDMLQVAIDVGMRFGIRILGAIALWIVGRMLIGFCVRFIGRWLVSHRVDHTLGLYIASAAAIGLNIVLVIAILGLFGVETTTFAAFIAAAGVAIGIAWGGLLGNFAAGVFLVIFRPFKAGDFVTAGGVTGTVQEIGMFATSINSPDNVRTIVGNNKIVGDTIQNFSANPYRRVDLTAQLAHVVDVNEAVGMLRARLVRIPNVLAQPAPDVEILQFNLAGPVLAVRPYCDNAHYWQVYFDTNRIIREAFSTARYPVPEQHFRVQSPAS